MFKTSTLLVFWEKLASISVTSVTQKLISVAKFLAALLTSIALVLKFGSNPLNLQSAKCQ